MNEEMKMAVNTIIDEMGRMEAGINKKFEKTDMHFNKIERDLESLWIK